MAMRSATAQTVRRTTAVALILAAANLGLAHAAPAKAEGPFAGLNGSWTGSGQIRLANGESEALKCKAYYTPKDGTGLGLAIRCASASNKIDLRANLVSQSGRVSG